MSLREAKALYYAMLDSGELLEFYTDLTGDWEEDKDFFTKEYDSNNRMMDGDIDFLDTPFDNEYYY